MPIHYVLHENNLTSDPNDYRAQVQSTSTAEMDQVIERMIEHGSTVVKADILSVLEDYHSAIESMVLEGFFVTTPGANYRASIKGTFDGLTDSYDPSRHQVVARVSSGVRFRNAIKDRATVSKQEPTKPKPSPIEYFDINSGERNSVLTSGGMGRIRGHRLKFDASDANQGIFFVSTAQVQHRVEVIGKNMPGELIFNVPELTAGDYYVSVRVDWGEGDIRVGTLEELLTVS